LNLACILPLKNSNGIVENAFTLAEKSLNLFRNCPFVVDDKLLEGN
jgi:hypothetical protein